MNLFFTPLEARWLIAAWSDAQIWEVRTSGKSAGKPRTQQGQLSVTSKHLSWFMMLYCMLRAGETGLYFGRVVAYFCSVAYLFEQGFTESLGGPTVVNRRQWIYVDFWCLGHLPWMQAEHAGKNEMLSCNKGVPVHWVWENLKRQKFSSYENTFKLQNIIRIWFCCCHDLSWECLSCLWTSTTMYICSPLFTANPLRNIMPQSHFWGVNVNIQF